MEHEDSGSGDEQREAAPPSFAPRPLPFSPPKPPLDQATFLRVYAARGNLAAQDVQATITIRRERVEAHALWTTVRQLGGHASVTLRRQWAAVARSLGLPPWNNASSFIRHAYETSGLLALEEMVDSGAMPLDVPLPPGQPAQALLQQHQQQQPLSDQHQHQHHHYQQQQQHQQQPLDYRGSDAGVAAAAAMVHVQGPDPMPASLEVTCGAVHGMFLVERQRVSCMCDSCVATAGIDGHEMSLTEFERHGGFAGHKKWRKSITVTETGAKLGQWLDAHGITILSASAQTKAARRRVQAEDAALQLGGQVNAEAAAAAAAGVASDAAAAAAGSSQDQAAAEGEEVQTFALQQLMHAYTPHHAQAFLTGGGHWLPEQQPSLQQRLAQAGAWEPAPSNNLAGLQQGDHWQNTGAPDASDAIVRSGAAASGDQHAVQPGPQQCVGCRIALCCGGQEWHGATVEAFDEASQLHLVCHDDGEQETVDLRQEQWRLEEQQQPGGSDKDAAAAAAAPAAAGALPRAGEADRPLRVMYEAAGQRLRVLLVCGDPEPSEWPEAGASDQQQQLPQDGLQPEQDHLPAQQPEQQDQQHATLLVPALEIEEPPRVAGSAGPEVAVRVMCGPKPGTFLVNTREVVCHCDECVRSHAETGVLLARTPNAFERHGGLVRARRWRSSIKVQLPDNRRVGLGSFLERYEAQQQQQQQQQGMQRQEQLLLLAQQHTLEAAGAQQAGWQWGPLQPELWLTDEQLMQQGAAAAHGGSSGDLADGQLLQLLHCMQPAAEPASAAAADSRGGGDAAALAGSESEDADPPPSIVSGVLGRLAQWAGPVGLKRPPPHSAAEPAGAARKVARG